VCVVQQIFAQFTVRQKFYSSIISHTVVQQYWRNSLSEILVARYFLYRGSTNLSAVHYQTEILLVNHFLHRGSTILAQFISQKFYSPDISSVYDVGVLAPHKTKCKIKCKTHAVSCICVRIWKLLIRLTMRHSEKVLRYNNGNNLISVITRRGTGVAQSVHCLTTDSTTGVRSTTGAEDFSSSPCVQTGSGAHPASCPVGTGGPFPGGKALSWRDADHSPPSSAEVKYE
jgi:hypothetical protein